jgi:phosphoribosylamine--glycine ligase
MRVLVIGSGAREHALAATLSADPGVDAVVCVPGNPGISALARTVNADVSDPEALLGVAERERIDFTVVGPEHPLSLGIVDAFAARARAIFGPTEAAARLESSKAFAKAFMTRHGIPTARFQTCDGSEAALKTLRSGQFGFPVVIKADGLAAGKGVVIATDFEEAASAVIAAMDDARFGAAGSRIVVEECLKGPEVSYFVISDGERVLPIGTAQDHKRIFDNDRGPNTGGMGAFAPSPLIDGRANARIIREIVEPVVTGMAAEGHPFRGFLYVGLMLTDAGPQVIEFNVRLGDPEAQVILPLLDEPLLPILAAAAEGNLKQRTCRLSDSAAVGVVLASRGYPESAESGRRISGLDDAERIPGVTICHAATRREDGHLVTAGGRVLTVVGQASTMARAIETAYAGVQCISFDGMQYRKDIGRRRN